MQGEACLGFWIMESMPDAIHASSDETMGFFDCCRFFVCGGCVKF